MKSSAYLGLAFRNDDKWRGETNLLLTPGILHRKFSQSCSTTLSMLSSVNVRLKIYGNMNSRSVLVRSKRKENHHIFSIFQLPLQGQHQNEHNESKECNQPEPDDRNGTLELFNCALNTFLICSHDMSQCRKVMEYFCLTHTPKSN